MTSNASSSCAPLPGLNIPERGDSTSNSASEGISKSVSASEKLRVGLCRTDSMSENGDCTRCTGATLLAAACRSERRSIEPMSAVLYIAGTSGVDAREDMFGDARESAPLRVTEREDAAELTDIGVGDRGDIAAGEGTWGLRCRSASGLLADDGGRATTGGSAASVGLIVLEDCGGETGEVGKDESKSTCVGDIGLKGMNTLDSSITPAVLRCLSPDCDPRLPVPVCLDGS